jgi:ubiquinone/menaquinone biosynthesis C-methylase UbiE
MTEPNIKLQVREFYDQVGWKKEADGLYQNAHYEDLREVSAEYIHRCHMRIPRHLKSKGRYLLDAGSGPVQYQEYIDYLRGFQFRVCADISITALKEARERLGESGLYVVADIANLPFQQEIFEGVMSMHTIHHLPIKEHQRAYDELYRVLGKGCTATVVNGWTGSNLTGWLENSIRKIRRARKKQLRKNRIREYSQEGSIDEPKAKGTFVQKNNPAWLKSLLDGRIPYRILVWRSASVFILRNFIHPWLGGKWLLRLLYALEERFPRFFGLNGQYPLVIITKPYEG